MLIDCPSCARSYHVSRASIGESGRTVICPLCEARWFVDAPASDDMLADVSVLDEAPIEDLLEPPMGEIQADIRDRPTAAPLSAPPRERVRTAKRKRASASGSGLRQIAAGIACIALAMGLIAKRATIVRTLPRTAAIYAALGMPVNTLGLEFSDVRTARSDDPDKHVEISGTIRNIERTRTTLPRLAFEIRDALGVTLATWTENAPKRVLASNETIPFVTQPSKLPAGSKDVVVRFEDGSAPTNLLTSLVHASR